MIEPDELYDDLADQAGEGGAKTPRFEVDDELSADWAARKLERVHAEMARVEEQAAEVARRAAEWRDRELARLAGDERYFAGLLEGWHRKVLADQEAEGVPESKRRKTIPLPSGAELQARKQQPKFEIVDLDALVEWAEATIPGAVKVEKKVPIPELKKAGSPAVNEAGRPILEDDDRTPIVTGDGERIPGVAARVPAGPRYKIVTPAGTTDTSKFPTETEREEQSDE